MEPEPPAVQPGVGKAALGLGKATVVGTNKAARTVTRKVITASKADGAQESGLTHLIWNQVLSYGADAMITVALAGTVFFGASAHAQRGNVLLYLVVTMAPFALIAPIIGPVLDRFQHGRRWTMAGTGVGRCILALIMAMHPTELLVLYPCALGSLVLSKAYAVVRAAAAPRLVPPGMTLTSANARVTIFGLGSTVVLGGLVGVIIKTTGSYSLGLVVTAIGFAACAVFAFKLPPQIDSAAGAPRHPEEPMRPRAQIKVAPLSRLHGWARRGFDPHVVVALQGESALRLLSGLQTIYLAFYVESTAHGFDAALRLGGVIVAAGAGNFLGTAIGTRAKMAHPSVVIFVSAAAAAVACIVTAVTFSILVATIAFLVCASGNSLSKIALDSLIQNDVVETLRSSAFARSETFLQLAWVVGAGIAVAIPSSTRTDGTIAFVVAAVLTGAAAIVVGLRTPRHPAHGPCELAAAAPVKLLIVTAVEAERAAVLAAAPDAHVLAAGIGPAASAAATSATLAADRYDLVVSAGIAGGFAPLSFGDVAVAALIEHADLRAETADGHVPIRTATASYPVEPRLAVELADRTGGRLGTIVTVSTVTGSAASADDLLARYPDVVAEAMEGAGVAAAATHHGVPYAEVRTISNTVGPRDKDAWRVPEALAALGKAMAAVLEP